MLAEARRWRRTGLAASAQGPCGGSAWAANTETTLERYDGSGHPVGHTYQREIRYAGMIYTGSRHSWMTLNIY